MARSKKTEVAAQEATPPEEPFRTYCRVELAGRLAAAPVVRSTSRGTVTQFRVAINDTRGAHFFDVVSWDPAEWEPDTLTTGAKLVLAGRLRTRSWKAADGSTRWATEIAASKVRRA